MHTFISPHGPCRMTVIEFDLELELELRLDDGDGERDDDDDDYHKARQDIPNNFGSCPFLASPGYTRMRQRLVVVRR